MPLPDVIPQPATLVLYRGDDTLLSPQQVAAILGTSRAVAWRLMLERAFGPPRNVGRSGRKHYRVTWGAVQRYLRRKEGERRRDGRA